MERVNAERRLRTVIRDSILDPPGTIAGYQLNVFPLRRRQFPEEAFKNLFTEALRRPDHSVRIVIDYYGDVLVTLLVGSLVDPDFHQTVKSFVTWPGLLLHSADHRADSVPTDPQILGHCFLRQVQGHPGSGILKPSGML